MATSDEFVIEKTLGEGAFGKVFLVTGSGDGQKYAMKVINIRTAPEDERVLAVREANLLRDLNHTNVLRYTDSFESDGALCIVTEFCENGDLSEYLEKRNKTKSKLEEDQLTEWFRQISSALEYLHGKKIVHRDVKTPNVFLTKDWQTKLGDMGLAKVLEKPSQKAVTFCGSPYYMSPEIFACKPYDSKSDIWALGVIVYEMATLERPFDATLMHQLVFKVVHGDLPVMPVGYKPELSILLSLIMQKDPEKRPTATGVLEHPFFKGSVAPKVAPKPVDGGMIRSRYGINRAQRNVQGNHKAGPFDMKILLDTLSKVRQSEQTKTPTKDDDKYVPGLKSIIATKEQEVKAHKKTKKFNKDLKSTLAMTNKLSVLSLTDVNLSVTVVDRTVGREMFEKTLVDVQNKTATEAFNVMQMIVKTMTGVLPDNPVELGATGGPSDAKDVMLHQIKRLQMYCVRVLNNDMALFRKAYRVLSEEKDEKKLEEKLIMELGPEFYGLCGVQLMFLKNFEYNVEKL